MVSLTLQSLYRSACSLPCGAAAAAVHGKWCAQKGQAGSCLPSPCCDDKTLVARKGITVTFCFIRRGRVKSHVPLITKLDGLRLGAPLVDGEKPIYLFRLQSRAPLWAGLRRGNSSSNILQCVVQYSGGWTGTGLFCCCVRCTITGSFAHYESCY
jgi:hypothetical protein